MNYYLKYIKYKNKYINLKKINGGMNNKRKHEKQISEDIDPKKETKLFKEFKIPEKEIFRKQLDFYPSFDDISNNEIFNKFIISCHGEQLINKKYNKIKIPKGYEIYFQAENGNECHLDEYDANPLKFCYNDDELLNQFRNVQYKTEEDIIGRKWMNKYCEGDIIYDCALQGNNNEIISKIKTINDQIYKCTINNNEQYECINDHNKKIRFKVLNEKNKKYQETIISKVIFCDKTFGFVEILDINYYKDILLSDIIVIINEYITTNSLSGPYKIFCSFCLVQNQDYEKILFTKQNINKTKLADFMLQQDIVSNPRKD